ncbi:MAG: oligosaccharide repeat unit polymerase [Ruminococcaceae bacterium]|nr:oligosaccharide repeat unit polymerase [Oscillospiraceae bacterium]
MLWVLFILLLFLTVMSYYMCDRDVMAPPFILNALFLLCSVFAIVGNIGWKVLVSVDTVLVIVLGLAAILVGGVFAQALYKSRKLTVKKAPTYNQGYIYISNTKLVFMLVIDIIIFVLYARRLIEMATEIGYDGTMLLQYIRVATINNNMKVGNFFTIMLGLIGASSNVALFALINNHFYKNKNVGGLKTNRLLCLAIIAVGLISKAMGGARNGFIMFFVALVAYYALCNPKKKQINLMRILPIACVCLFAFLIIFTELGKLTGKVGEDATEKFVLYAGSSIVGLSVWLNGYTPSRLFGQESFWGARYMLKKFFPSVESSPQFLTGVHFSNKSGTNIFTGFRSYIADFGWIGMIAICILIGLFITIAYYFVRKNTKPINIIIFSYFLYYFINMLFAPSITADLFTTSQIFSIIWYVIVVAFAIGRSSQKKQLEYGNIQRVL